jgi:NTE family protein
MKRGISLGRIWGVHPDSPVLGEDALGVQRAKSMGSVIELRGGALLLAACVALSLTGCACLRTVNTPLEKHDPKHGYRPREGSPDRYPGRAVIFLAFSGGGTRAAALAYGVLEELRATEISADGTPTSLLGEVDTISGVSGGSFPAAYYGLYGDRIFEEFEPRFLKKNIQAALIRRSLLPWNLVRLMTPLLSRSDLASRYYHENVFDGATFADLTAAKGPRIHINATDLSSGERFTFNQDSFDVICSDVDKLPIATAVAASSAVPMLLSPITLRNHAGTCGYEAPEWVVEALKKGATNPRINRSAQTFMRAQDTERKKYFHLVDGVISDNLGLRVSIDFVTAAGGAKGAREVSGIEVPDHMAFIVVNAETYADPAIDLSDTAPSLAMLLNTVTGAQIRRYNFETLVLAEELLHHWGRDLSTADRRVMTHMIHVSFAGLGDEEERRYFDQIPTNFNLSDEEVDRLREAGRRLLRDSPDFQELLRALE